MILIVTDDINKYKVEGSDWFLISQNINVNKVADLKLPTKWCISS